ncbi:MAG: protease complex subunit PrcB family protein [Clostridiaceae bacterium]|nr:protease complex subunit PrcB family protein [Clostridiaceae bacterium]
MKKFFILIISMLLIVALVACAAEPEPAPTPPEEPAEEGETVVEKYTIEEGLEDRITIVEEEEVLQEAREWFQQFDETQEGAYVFEHPEITYIRINPGAQPTGGYGIHIKDYDEEEYPRIITMEVIAPDEDALVTQVQTYPSATLAIISDSVSQYEVRTGDGEVLESESTLVFANLETPQDNEAIFNPVRVRGKIIAFEGAFVVRILDEEEELIHEEPMQAYAGGPYWGDFDAEVSYPTPQTEEGSLEIGEYSAKDGEYLLREKIAVRFRESEN